LLDELRGKVPELGGNNFTESQFCNMIVDKLQLCNIRIWFIQLIEKSLTKPMFVVQQRCADSHSFLHKQ